jgi:hypothetical protein
MAYDPLSLLTPRRLPVSAVDEYAQGLLGYQKTDPLSALSGMPDMTDATLLQPTQRSPGFMSSLGNAFTGQGSSARLQALGAALLSGPSRTPISFGSQLAKGLLAGTQLAEQQKEAELQRSLLRQERMDPNYKRINVGGDDMLIDTNPNSPTFQQVISPTMAQTQQGISQSALPENLTAEFTTQELKSVPLVEDAAQGEVGTKIARALSKGLGAIDPIGLGLGRENFENEAFVNNLNKEMQVELTKDLGGRLTGVVSATIEEIMPKPNMINEEFRARAKNLIDFGERRILQIKEEMPNLSAKERKVAQNSINSLSDRIRTYKAMLEKQRQFDTSSGIYSKEQESTEALMDEAASLLGGNQ